ncbi:MAG: hypothetical protein QOI59_665 [Gammaproteobacteria bacterium]|jgi:hypothetical protein|nr:hypothetical protein [Gammaproteobacteria bacterium]
MTTTTEKYGSNRSARKLGAAVLGVLAAVNMASAMAGIVNGNDKRNVISFNLAPNPKTLECLRGNYNEEPRARATIVRGKLNDTLILDLDGIKPGLQFDLFTVQNSFFLASGSADPKFTGSFGLAWYQSDIEIPRHSDRGHVRISTILLDQIFGFDPDVKLPPTNTFHVGFWFNNPEDAAPCGFNPAAPTPFNGEHKAGPFAMISVPDPDSHLGPLCTDPNLSTTPVSCDP